MSQKGTWAAAVSSWLIALFVVFSLAGPSSAHEVQPAVSDVEIAGDRVDITIEMTLEAPVAGIDLEGLADTNEAENAEAYDARRAMSPADLEADLRNAWPGLARQITLRAGETDLDLALEGVEIPEVGDVELARISTIRLGATLPPGDDPIVFGWDAALGGLIVRQVGVENGYTAFLENGRLTAPIPREGGDTRTAGQVFVDYVISGFDHIIPKGLDHILFVLGLFFFALRWGPLLWQVSAFTLAHTITLALATLGIVNIPDEWMWAVEAAIAASICYVAIENIFRPTLGWLRPAVVFGFGLLHGLGFASVLGEFGLPTGQYIVALLSFNLGVELGQLAVILGAFLLIAAARFAADIANLDDDEALVRDLPLIYRAVSLTGSLLIALVGLYWTLERVGFLG